MPELHLAQHPEADRMLSEDPLALLIGMVLDQQVPLEWAFQGPFTLRDRLGHDYDAAQLAEMDPATLTTLFATRPALHRYPASMAKRVLELARHVVDEYDGKAENLWNTATSGIDLRRRVEALPGFGAQKARIFVALLGKQLGVRPPGWEEAAGDYAKAGTFMSVADIRDPDTLARVRAYKQAKKAAVKAQTKDAPEAKAKATPKR